MDEELTKSCPNCKRDIPSVNYTIHTVHCARNIRVCPVCKEPVPLSELERHHDELHKQLPCKQCGEKVCGTDLEDHLRDSCANTIKSCRFCELELARRELPAHEGYCGVRTEQCPECREWVMIKYRQLHLDSNHGFLRLDDDPAPIPKKEVLKSNINRTFANQPSTSNGFTRSTFNNDIRNNAAIALTWRVSNCNTGRSTNARTSASDTGSNMPSEPSSSNRVPGTKVPSKRTNDQPQININVGGLEKINKDLPSSSGIMKKRQAPKPPVRAPPPNPQRDMPYYSALERHQREEKQRQEQNAHNLSVGLPPVLNPAQKVEKLRKMDALQNREILDNDFKHRLQGRVWAPTAQDVGNILGHQKTSRTTQTVKPGLSQERSSHASTSQERPSNASTSQERPSNASTSQERPSNASTFQERPSNASTSQERPSNASTSQERPSNVSTSESANQSQNIRNLPGTSSGSSIPSNSNLKNKTPTAPNDEEVAGNRDEFKNLKPMTPEEFMARFNELQLRKDDQADGRNERSGDRFSEIKSSLRELRRGLNEVTAPYNVNTGTAFNNLNNEVARLSPCIAMDVSEDEEDDDQVELPCEFCGVPVPMDSLVQHQTGCRPDLAQYRVPDSPPGAGRAHVRSPVRPRRAPPHDEPVIPCEFCSESLPVYLIADHQKCCGGGDNRSDFYYDE